MKDAVTVWNALLKIGIGIFSIWVGGHPHILKVTSLNAIKVFKVGGWLLILIGLLQLL